MRNWGRTCVKLCFGRLHKSQLARFCFFYPAPPCGWWTATVDVSAQWWRLSDILRASSEDVSSLKPGFTSFLSDPLDYGRTRFVTTSVSVFQATRQFLEEINKWTSQHGVSPLSRELAVKFLMARKFDVLRAIELFHSYRVRASLCTVHIRSKYRVKWTKFLSYSSCWMLLFQPKTACFTDSSSFDVKIIGTLL